MIKVGKIYKKQDKDDFVKVIEVTNYFDEKSTIAYIVFAGPCQIKEDLDTVCLRGCHHVTDFEEQFEEVEPDITETERCLIRLDSKLYQRADSENWDKLIQNLKKGLAEFNSKTGEKLMIQLEEDYIPITKKNEDGSVEILGRLY